MPGFNRSAGRNLHLFNSTDKDTVIGGLILTNGVTNSLLYAMVEIIVVFSGEFTLQNEEKTTILRDDAQVVPGDYFIHAAGKIY